MPLAVKHVQKKPAQIVQRHMLTVSLPLRDVEHGIRTKDGMRYANDSINLYNIRNMSAVADERVTTQHHACLSLESTTTSLVSSFNTKHQLTNHLPSLNGPGHLDHELHVTIMKKPPRVTAISY